MRHRQRMYALQSLYAFEQTPSRVTIESYDPFCFVSDKKMVYAEELFYGVHRNLEFIDNILNETLKEWSIERLLIVDRCILRLSIYSLYFEDHMPVSIVIDEAVELAKQYSDKKSSAFVNGILDSIAKQRNSNVAT